MADDIENETGPPSRLRLLQQLDKMVGSGRVTEPEADRLRSASAPHAFDAVVRDIRARHVGSRLESAVADGALSQDEADGLLQRVTNGEHFRSLRAHLGKLRRGTRPPNQGLVACRSRRAGPDGSAA